MNLVRHIYINADADVCFNRIHKRSRNGESRIELTYLEKCKKYHDNWLGQYDKWDCNNDTTISTKVLNLLTNENASYINDDTNDPGNKWISQIEQCIQKIIIQNKILHTPPNSPTSK